MRTCKVKGTEAIFHDWFMKARVIPPSPMIGGHTGGVVQSPVGIVEYKSGKVEEVCPHEIQFVDNQGEPKGLFTKYDVFKAGTTEKVFDCFVLRPDKDKAAYAALKTYAVNTTNEDLAKDIYLWLADMPIGGPKDV